MVVMNESTMNLERIGFYRAPNQYSSSQCKANQITGLVTNQEFMRINTKSPKFSLCLIHHTQKVVSCY